MPVLSRTSFARPLTETLENAQNAQKDTFSTRKTFALKSTLAARPSIYRPVDAQNATMDTISKTEFVSEKMEALFNRPLALNGFREYVLNAHPDHIRISS